MILKIIKVEKQNKTIYVTFESKIGSIINSLVNWRIKRALIKARLLPKDYKTSRGQKKSMAVFMSSEDFEVLNEIKGGNLK